MDLADITRVSNLKKPKLKPCPFCGARAEGPRDYGFKRPAVGRFIDCPNCGAFIFRAFDRVLSPEQTERAVIYAWNARSCSRSLPCFRPADA